MAAYMKMELYLPLAVNKYKLGGIVAHAGSSDEQ